MQVKPKVDKHPEQVMNGFNIPFEKLMEALVNTDKENKTK